MASGQQCSDIPVIEYDDVVQGLKNKSFLLLDVRGAAERAAGMIPGAKVLPVDEIADAVKLDCDTFEAKYGFTKPSEDQKIVTYCRSGNRSMRAAQTLCQLNYHNVSNYKGSWTEWAQKHPEDVIHLS